MIIVEENNECYKIDDVQSPISASHCWVLDLQQLDYTLNEIKVLEEIVGPSLAIDIAGFQFSVPSDWNILIMDEDTSQLDVTSIESLTSSNFKAMAYDFDKGIVRAMPLKVIDYSSSSSSVNPALNRHTMLCHPISRTHWINIAPNDPYNKYLKNLAVGDII
jgi:hypothetical protein